MIAPLRPLDDRGGMDFLGPELLTWLWWRAGEDPRLVHPNGTELYVHLDEHMEWRGERSAARRTTLRSGVPGASAEARAALRSGKSLVAARLLFARGEEEVRFTLRGEDLDVSSVRLTTPTSDTAEGAAERFEGSLDALDRFLADLDLCLSEFLRVRCAPSWEAELGRIRAWAALPSADG